MTLVERNGKAHECRPWFSLFFFFCSKSLKIKKRVGGIRTFVSI